MTMLVLRERVCGGMSTGSSLTRARGEWGRRQHSRHRVGGREAPKEDDDDADILLGIQPQRSEKLGVPDRTVACVLGYIEDINEPWLQDRKSVV